MEATGTPKPQEAPFPTKWTKPWKIALVVLGAIVAGILFWVLSGPAPTQEYIELEARNPDFFDLELATEGLKLDRRTEVNGGADWSDRFWNTRSTPRLSYSYFIDAETDPEAAGASVVAELEAMGWDFVREEPSSLDEPGEGIYLARSEPWGTIEGNPQRNLADKLSVSVIKEQRRDSPYYIRISLRPVSFIQPPD